MRRNRAQRRRTIGRRGRLTALRGRPLTKQRREQSGNSTLRAVYAQPQTECMLRQPYKGRRRNRAGRRRGKSTRRGKVGRYGAERQRKRSGRADRREKNLGSNSEDGGSPGSGRDDAKDDESWIKTKPSDSEYSEGSTSVDDQEPVEADTIFVCANVFFKINNQFDVITCTLL